MTATYQYSVRDRSGKLLTGTLAADSETAVAQRLRAMGFAPISINVANAGLKKEISIPGFGNRVKMKDLAVMSRQFATMINSGLSLLRALTILREQTQSKALQKVLTEVRNDVETGSSLSAAMSKHPRAFPPLMVNMIRAGEVGGFLDSVLLEIAANYEAEVKLRSKVKSAMTYPVVVLCISLLAVLGMLTFVVPVFAKMFKQLGGKLPAPTQFLVTLSHSMKVLLPVLIVLAIVGGITWSRIRRTEAVRNVVDPFKLKVPIFGQLFRKLALARFARNLGTMMHSGVPILQALDIVADTTGNVVLARAIRDVQGSIRSGESLTAPLTSHPIFPPMVVQMMAVGEDTGALDTMLGKIAQFYDQEVEAMTESLTALIEPIMIALLGGIVGSMIVALYLPIFHIYDLVSGSGG
ncbi:type II secretion system protein [Acidothermus cellulolyticus 11B]|uniref:Type II secretion system protein n=1 Tax=Acidothermus cellulolyticus (strain ATCC 43068 / DSM 8971 / 11B) TaxID=351607 RepID=A0LUI2_ACIC1|nr:type II secretion system F family protein [Acidothermus cellulolyticus]ABK53092.1 type II secretion system protein [Acidothermus cellulolyticus 11B]